MVSLNESLPYSVFRSEGTDPSFSSPHLRNSTRGAATKAPLPPGPTSVFSVNRDWRVAQRAVGSSNLPVIDEDQNVSSVKQSRQSVTSYGFDWLDDDESTVFKVQNIIFIY